jgi:hypothetical protein
MSLQGVWLEGHTSFSPLFSTAVLRLADDALFDLLLLCLLQAVVAASQCTLTLMHCWMGDASRPSSI